MRVSVFWSAAGTLSSVGSNLIFCGSYGAANIIIGNAGLARALFAGPLRMGDIVLTPPKPFIDEQVQEFVETLRALTEHADRPDNNERATDQPSGVHNRRARPDTIRCQEIK